MPGYKPAKIAYDKIEPDGGSDPFLCPVIFIHGLTQLKEYWKDIPKKVANTTKRTVYAIDARNHGESECTNEFNFDLVALDLVHFMDTLDIPKAILVGHSMGGIASMKAALKHPERFERIVLEDIGVKRLMKVQLQALAYMITLLIKAAEATSPEQSEEEAKRFIVQSVDSNLTEEIKKMRGKDRTPEDLYNTLHIKRAEDGRWTNKANLAAILEILKKGEVDSEFEGTYGGPSLFIYGTISHIKVQEQEDLIKNFFPNSELVPIENANHSVHMDRPVEFTEALLKFLS